MLVLLEGRLASATKKYPDTDKKEKFKSHQSLKIIQRDEQGEVQLHRVKDFNMDTVYVEDEMFSTTCNVDIWNFNNKTGMSCRVAVMGKEF